MEEVLITSGYSMTSFFTLLLLTAIQSALALGPPKFASVEEVLTALRSDQPGRRLAAARFLSHSADHDWVHRGRDRISSGLTALLDDKEPDVRDSVLDTLGLWLAHGTLSDEARADFAKALRPLVKRRGHPVRAGLARKLAALDPAEKPTAVAALRDLLDHDTNEASRVNAATGLIELSPHDKPLVIKTLRSVMTDGKSAAPRVDAAEKLVKLEPEDQPAAIKVCREIARTAAGMPALSAATALRWFKEIDFEEWVILVAGGMERSDDPNDHGNMASVLSIQGPKGKAAVPSLLRVMAGSSDFARVNAASALLAIDPTREKEVLPVALAGLKDPYMRGTAADILDKLGPAARNTLPDLRAALKAVAAQDDDWRASQRVSLLTAIGKVDPAGIPEAVAGLRDIFRRSNSMTQLHAASALGKFGPAAKEAVPDLVEYGRSRAIGISRVALAVTLGKIGSGARAAEPLLREWAKAEDEDLRKAAEEALVRIAGKPGSK